jgi:hypothetical protein
MRRGFRENHFGSIFRSSLIALLAFIQKRIQSAHKTIKILACFGIQKWSGYFGPTCCCRDHCEVRENIQMSVILSRATEMQIAAGCSVGDLMEHLKRYQAAARSKAKGKEQKKEAGADDDPELSENNKSKDSGTLGSEGDGDPPEDNPNASKSANGMTDPTQQNAGVEAVNLILQRNLSPIPAGEANRPIVDASKAEGREPG